MILRRPFVFLIALGLLGASHSAMAADRTTWDGAAISGGGLPFEPTFAEIQANIFTPSCALSFCHGAAMQMGMDLREGAAYQSIVGVPSFEVPDKFRIAPFLPDESYMICKLENCSWVVGSQMPLIGGPLPSEVIAVMRAWVQAGALEFSPISVENQSWGRVKALYKD